MKSKIISAICISGASVILAGCTTTTTTERTAATEVRHERNRKDVYTQEQMRRTGEQSPGAALEKLDPAVTISGTRQ